MLVQKTFLEIKIGERTYDLICQPDAPLGEVHDILTMMKQYVVNRILEQQKIESQGATPNDVCSPAAAEAKS